MSVVDSTHAGRGSRRRLLLSLGCGGALALGSIAVGFTPTVTAGVAPPTTNVQLLAFNDYHGHVEDDTAGDIDDAPAGGGEYLSTKLAELRAGNENSLTVAAGDLIGGSPFFSGGFHDEPSVESLNAMGLDVSGVGNHEFDEGVTELLRMQNGGCHPDDGCYFDDYDTSEPGDQEFGGADFNWLAANVTEDGVTDPVSGRPETPLPEYQIEDVGGEQIAFIGMTLEDTDALVARAGVTGYTFQDEVETANALIPEIKAAGVEAIVVLIHEGGSTDTFAIQGCDGISGPIVEIAENLDAEIDVITSGHTHQPYTCEIDDPDDNPRSVSSAYSFGRVVTDINLMLDTDGEVIRESVTAVNEPVIQSELEKDPAVTAVVDKWAPLSEELGETPIGEISADINRGGDPTGSDRGVESAAGNLVADAQLAATESVDAQIAFMNPGGVRSDLTFAESDGEGDGVVTFGEAFTFQPFNNILQVFPMTGAQIVSVLEEQCQPAGSSRPFLHLGVSDGFTYDLATTIEDGGCTGIQVRNVQLDGEDIDLDATYQVVANNFLADGGDNFATFEEIPTDDRIGGGQDITALNEYLANATAPIEPPSTDRVDEIDFEPVPAIIESREPARLLDTRGVQGTIDGEFEGDGALEAGGEIELQVTGRDDIPEDASSVLLNIGAVQPTDRGFLTVYPCSNDRPVTSTLNYVAGRNVANLITVKLDDEGKVCIYTSAETQLIADYGNFVPDDGTPVSIDPVRLLDSRTGPSSATVDGDSEGEGPAAAGSVVQVEVTDRGGIPNDAKAVVLNVGAISPTEKGFLTVYPCGEDRPQASNVNYLPGDAVSNSVTAAVGDGDEVCIYTFAETNLIVDATAYVPFNGTPEPFVPARLVDTRTGSDNVTIDGDFEGDGRIVAGEALEIDVAGRGPVPDDADTVFLSVASIQPDGPGYLTFYPCDAGQPLASNVNYVGGDIVSNGVTVKVDDEGKVCVYSFAETDLIVDVTAAVSAPTDPAPPADNGPSDEFAGSIDLDFDDLGESPDRCEVVGESCLLPFPSDALTVADDSTVTGRRVNLSGESMPVNADGVAIDVSRQNRNDGFSPGSAALVLLPGVDPDASGLPPITDIAQSLGDESASVIIDATTGEVWPHWAEVDSNADDPDRQGLFLRPATNYPEGHRIVVGLRNIVDGEGAAIEPTDAFRAYRDRLETDVAVVEARRSSMEQVFADLDEAGVERDELVMAWDFTVISTESLTGPLIHMRDDAFGELGDAAPSFTITSVDEQTVEGRVVVDGTYDVPLYLNGDGTSGTGLNLTDDPDLPTQNGVWTATFRCQITDASSGDDPGGGVVYGHGLLGSERQVTSAGPTLLARNHNFVVCGTALIGMAEDDIGNAAASLVDPGNFPTLVDRLLQGHLNTLFLGRLMKHPDGFVADPMFQDADGRPLLDVEELSYYGISQGGIMGPVSTAISRDWDRGVFGVPGINYSTLLNRSVDFDTFQQILDPAFPDKLDQAIVILTIQMLWDRGEGNGYAGYFREPLEGLDQKFALIQGALGDFQVANVAMDVMARTMGASVGAPDVRTTDIEPFWGIDRIESYPFDGSAVFLFDSGTPLPPITNTPPRDGVDPHEDVRRAPAAYDQIAAFLQPPGMVIDTCNAGPCIIEPRE